MKNKSNSTKSKKDVDKIKLIWYNKYTKKNFEIV